MKKTCRVCGVELHAESNGLRCNPCIYKDAKSRDAKYLHPKRKPVVLGLNCPWQNYDFLRGWQGRLPDPEWGF